MNWISINDELPPENVTVETQIRDENGARNKRLLYRKGNLWFPRGSSVYVYYTPTHWAYIDGEGFK